MLSLIISKEFNTHVLEKQNQMNWLCGLNVAFRQLNIQSDWFFSSAAWILECSYKSRLPSITCT
jgi:hypothetical protein